MALTGNLRQATAAAGAALRQVTGIADWPVRQRAQLWSSNQHYDEPLPPDVTEHSLDQGDELAVAVAVRPIPTEDILEFLRAKAVPVDRLLVLRPPAGTRDNAIPDARGRDALAVGIRDAVRQASSATDACTSSWSARWASQRYSGTDGTGCRPTVVYEDVRVEHTYEPAFSIDA